MLAVRACVIRYVVDCLEDQVRCSNLDDTCQYKREYMLCVRGPYRGKCMSSSAVCEDAQQCLGNDYSHICCEFAATFRYICSSFFVFAFKYY